MTRLSDIKDNLSRSRPGSGFSSRHASLSLGLSQEPAADWQIRPGKALSLVDNSYFDVSRVILYPWYLCDSPSLHHWTVTSVSLQQRELSQYPGLWLADATLCSLLIGQYLTQKFSGWRKLVNVRNKGIDIESGEARSSDPRISVPMFVTKSSLPTPNPFFCSSQT